MLPTFYVPICFLAILDSTELLDELLQNWNTTLPATLGYNHLNATDIEDVTRKINEFYFGSEATPTLPINIQSLLNASIEICTKSET